MRIIFVIVFLSLVIPSFVLATPSKQKNIPYTDSGQGTPLVLVHAFPTNKVLWQEQVKVLQAHFRVITLDLWGFGEADPVDGQPITMTAYAEAIKLLLDRLHIQRAIIGGESMGGYIALAFLAKYPQKVQGLILSNTQSIADNAATRDKREKSAQEVLTRGTADFLQQFSKNALSEYASDDTRIYLQSMLQFTSATAIAAALRGMALRPDTSALLKTYPVPTLIITSTHDLLVNPEESKKMHALAPQSRLVILENAGHLANLEKPQRWNEAVIHYFKNQQAQ